MIRPMAFLVALLLWAPAGWVQEEGKDNDKERQKQEEKQKEEEAKKALDAYKSAARKAKNTGEAVLAIEQHLETAEPHPLIRQELMNLTRNPSIDLRLAAAKALGKYKRDDKAARQLLALAKSSREPEEKKPVLRYFATCALFASAKDLEHFFHDENLEVAREAIDAIREINSLRMLKPLIDLLGELDAIKEDKKGEQDPGGGGRYGPPGAQGGTQGGDDRLKRKKELTKPVQDAINHLWKKYDDKLRTNTAVEAQKQFGRLQKFIQELISKEDDQDKMDRQKK